MDELEQVEFDLDLKGLLGVLPEQYCQIVLMRTGLDGGVHTYAEIGVELGITPDMARNRYIKAIEYLREMKESKQ
jgi:DNA-directed RNA polymerase sigma subunit (sigma70/sigma32)